MKQMFEIKLQMFDKSWRTVDQAQDRARAIELTKYYQHKFSQSERVKYVRVKKDMI